MKKSNLFLGVLFLLGVSILVFSQGKQREEVVQANFTESIHKGLKEKEKKELKNLVHELYHLVNRIAKDRGLAEDYDNEPQAYLLGWLFDEISKLK